MFTAGTLLLLFYEIRSGSWRRSSPHAANDSNTILRERGEAQFLALANLDALELLEAPESKLRQETGFQTSVLCIL